MFGFGLAINIALIGIGVFALLAVGNWSLRRATDAEGTHHEVWRQAFYQPTVLVIAFVLVLLNRWLTKPMDTLTEMGTLDAASEGFGWLGIPTGTSWTEVGLTFTVIPLVVTSLVVYLQQLRGRTIRWAGLPMALGLAVVFAFTNSLSEELIFRVLLIESWAPRMDPAWLAVVAGLVFGIPHYLGVPGKFPGVLMAGFLGWVLARSVMDTGGLAWAWLIHFAQDVPIFTMLLLLGSAAPKAASK